MYKFQARRGEYKKSSQLSRRNIEKVGQEEAVN